MRHVLHSITRPWLTSISSSSTLRPSPSAWNARRLLYRERLNTRPCCSPVSSSTHPEDGRPLAWKRRNVPLKYAPNESASPLHAFVNCKQDRLKHDDLVVIHRADPASWADLLERLLPPQQRTRSSDAPTVPADLIFAQALFWRSRQLLGTNATIDPSPLLWMVNNGRHKAVVAITDVLLKQIAAEIANARPVPLSNLDWPGGSLDDICCKPISCTATTFQSNASLRDEDCTLTEAQEIPAAQRVLGEVWSLVGHLVIQSADASDEDAEKLITATMLILARIHNFGLLPDHIYSHSSIPVSVTAQRPPILHMVSSRILAALSDATWRDQQDDAIAKAASLGMTLHQISRDVPGGRFRLKVRPLGAEIWLELILWCCIESGHSVIAARLIQQLQRDKTNPWYAIRWTSKDTGGLIESRIDRDRIKLRHGGVVGLIEGYSREKPFIEVPVRSISVESILALSDALINEIVNSNSAEKDMARSMEILASVVSFVEPHELSSTYLDYLVVRLIEAGVFDPSRVPTLLKDWTEHISRLRNLQPVDAGTFTSLSLNLDNIGRNALTHMALQHQALDALILQGDVHNALQVFNDIQEASDALKLKSVSQFLQSQSLSEEAPAPICSLQSEFVDSHGQLPGYKLAGFLNLVSDSNLINLGQWLLYADDIDGALIKPSMYGDSAFTAALFRFASTSANSTLLDQVQVANRARKLMPSVRQLRTLANALLSFDRFDPALTIFKELQRAAGGGAGLSNLVHIAALAIRIHGSPEGELRRSGSVARTLAFLPRLMGGTYKGLRSDFTQSQQLLFEQQVAHVALLLLQANHRYLRRVAEKILKTSHPGNVALLPARYFNVVLSAVVDVDGSTAGRRLWEMFCKDPQNRDGIDPRVLGDEIVDLEDSYAAELDADYQAYGHSTFMATSPEDLQPEYSALENLQTTEHDPRSSQDIPWSTKDSAEGNSTPITVPNLGTLRIILRAATAEKERKMTQGQDADEQNENLRWAVQTLRLFGMRREDVDSEFEEPLSTTLNNAYQSERRLQLEHKADTVVYVPRVVLDRRMGRMFSR